MKVILFIAASIISITINMKPSPMSNQVDTSVLIGTWKLDMSPQDPNDNNFAMMRIRKIKDSSFEGTFYREGVKIRNGKLNTQRDIVYGALISGDNSGEYHSTFYYKDGKLYGTTHAIQRGFLSTWVAEKE